MRHFHGLIFLGAGKHSIAEVEGLLLRVRDGASTLGGIQQGGHSDSEAAARENERQDEIGKRELEDVVRDVAAALLGREITFGAKLPYPPEPENGTTR